MQNRLNRRQMFQSLGGAAACLAYARPGWAAEAPTAAVAVAKCPDYGSELLPALARMFDQLGGLGKLVKGKTVAIKLNLAGDPSYRLGYTLPGEAQWVHPNAIAAVVHLMGRAGARRIRLLEAPRSSAAPLEEHFLAGNCDPREFVSAAPGVEFENTNYLGRAKKYSRMAVPDGGLMFKAFDLNHSYEDCDVFVSMTKLKEHITAGITVSIKNLLGITPCTIYGTESGVDEPSLLPRGGRDPFHDGRRQPSKGSPPENDPTSPRDAGYRIPRIVADLAAARPIHLAIADGIATMTAAEGPWQRGGSRTCMAVRPGVLIAGTNPVTTDAVGAAVMSFDPMADRGAPPFETCDNTLRFAEQHGLGTRDLRRIEVIGTPITEVRFNFRAHWKTPASGPAAALRPAPALPL